MTDIATRCRSFDRFLNSGISAWKQESGDVSPGASATNLPVLFGIREHDRIFESKFDHFEKVNEKMASNGPDEPIHPAGERGTGPRPLKSRPEDRIASIMDNPFYKSFGVRHPRSPRDVPSSPSSAKTGADTDGKYGVREDLGDYRPGSGFVHKLMGRFASLEVREEPSIARIKPASSVEDILDRTEHRAADTSERQRKRGRLLSDSAQHRARSVESITRKKGSLNLPVVLRHVERSQDHSTLSVKSPRDTHVVAPDVKLGRDDIILIENPPSEYTPAENETDEDATVADHMPGYSAENSTDELPKPNTVSVVRSLFESGKPLSPTSTHPGDVESEPSYTPRDSILTPRDSASAPRKSTLTPRDSNLTPRDMVLSPRDSNTNLRDTVLSPREPAVSPKDISSKATHQESRSYKPQSPRINADITQRYDATKNRFSWTSDHSRTAGTNDSSNSTAPPPLPTTFPPVFATAVSPAAESTIESDSSENIKPSMFQSSNSAENRPIASPRSTAAVKAIQVSRPSVASRTSLPNSTGISSSTSSTAVPPSFTPSIKKTSPVMPVAPFKENKTDEGEGNRYLIYSKKSSSTKPNKIARIRDYGEGSSDQTVDLTKQGEATEDLNKQGHSMKKSNKINGTHSKGQAPPIPKQRKSEERAFSPRSAEPNEAQWTNVLKPTSPRIEDSQPQPVTLTPVEPSKPAKAPRTFTSKHEDKMETNQTTAFSEAAKPDAEDTAADDTKAEGSNQPVKGIPSIIANRLKQNNQKQEVESNETKRPGELFGVRLGKTHHGPDAAGEENEIPQKRLTPASQKAQSSAESSLPSEIENQIASVRKRMEHASRNKPTGVSQIFDSSQLQKKRKEKQAAKSSAAAGVPRLDLSSITAEDTSNAGSAGGYRVTPRQIKPCNIEFIGGNVSLGRSMLKKNRTEKVRIHFNSSLEEKFEYPSEDSMLEEYLREHPEEALVLEESSSSSWPTESSDDTDQPETPRGGGSSLDNELLKSNTSLAHSGNLQSYRGKYQQDYELGSVLDVPEKEPAPSVAMEPDNPDSMQLLPASEADNQTWSLETSSDLLF